MLGRAPAPVYACPSCGGVDFIPHWVLTRPRAGAPWKQDKVGSALQCSTCGRMWAVTLGGIRPVVWIGPQSSPVGRPDATETRAMLDRLERDVITLNREP